jgi:hypothetical protein
MTADLDRVSSGAVAVRSSRTAETNALERAAEALHPAAGRLLDDPYAHLFVRRPLYRALLRLRPVALRALHRVDERYPGLHAEIMLRARYVDGLVEAANFEQLVLLGAGYDATAFRHQLGTSVRVFEVDSPQTQGAKRAGEAFTATLRDVASFAPSGARMILDYMDPDVIRRYDHEGRRSPRRRMGRQARGALPARVHARAADARTGPRRLRARRAPAHRRARAALPPASRRLVPDRRLDGRGSRRAQVRGAGISG